MKKNLVRILLAAALSVAIVLSLASCDMLPESILELIGAKKNCAHTEVEWIVDTPANCKVTGIQHSACKACGAVLESGVKIEKSDEHTPGEWETKIEPTCAEVGSRVQKCTVCKKAVNTEELPKSTVHSYHYGKCRVCRIDQPESTGLAFESNGNGTCTLTGMGSCTDTSLFIPETSPEGDTVVAIGAAAFKGKGLTSVIAPATITTAGNDAFGECPITHASVPAPIVASVKSNAISEITVNGGGKVPANAMQGATTLRVIRMLEGVTEVGENAFMGTRVTSIVMPDSLRTIRASAFANSGNLNILIIGSGVVELGERAFENCDFLYEVTIPASVLRIGSNAFHWCPRINKAVFEIKEGWKIGKEILSPEVMSDPALAAKKLNVGTALSRS